jgi:hypothetical protein
MMKIGWVDRLVVPALTVASVLVPFGARAQGPTVSEKIADVSSQFVSPPDDARVLMRWWWFGPAVTKPELEREILAMKAGGFGGFEIQPVYPLEPDDTQKSFRNLPYLSKDFLDAVSFAAQKARENHMRVDMTLASGWPYGGPHVPVSEAASRLRMAAIDVPSGATSFALPSLGNGESMLAVFVGDGSAKTYGYASLKQIEVHGVSGRAEIPASQHGRVVLCFLSSRTGQQVKRAAVNAEGFVLDHLSSTAVQNHLRIVAEPLLKAFGDNAPYSVFSDSLEVYNTDWTDDFLAEFQKRRGYDLKPHLPQLFIGDGVEVGAVRRDWGLTMTELVNERYLTPVNDWAIAHHTQFRSQTYGDPPVSLSSNRLVGLPEGEGPQWRSFSFTRLATSASHLYGRPVTSAETWTWLHSPAFRATPLDMKAEADRMFLEGVNQFVGHGWPYTPPGTPEPGWAFYAAAVFNDHNPWWGVMPDVTRYMQRMSYLLRQGKPANDIAVLLPNDDAYAEFKPGHASLSAEMKEYVTPLLTEQILDAGFNLDYVDAGSIDSVGLPYPVLVMPHVSRLSPETLKRIGEYAKKGGKVIVVGSKPSIAPGFLRADQVSLEVKASVEALFALGDGVQFVAEDAQVGVALHKALKPDMHVASDVADVGFVHRKLEDADVYFVANTSNHAVHTTAGFRTQRSSASWWDPFTGSITTGSAGPVALDLAPYESRVLVFRDGSPKTPAPAKLAPKLLVADLSHGWQVHFEGLEHQQSMESLRSWTDADATKFYSGEAIYRREFELGPKQLRQTSLFLDFGEGTPVEANPKILSGMRALLESPIREAAVVFVNGKRAGSVWHPPYALEVTPCLHAGKNSIEVRVGNTAINTLAGRKLPDYRLLNARYGERFVPQNMDNLQPLPSGMLGPVRLMGEKDK